MFLMHAKAKKNLLISRYVFGSDPSESGKYRVEKVSIRDGSAKAPPDLGPQEATEAIKSKRGGRGKASRLKTASMVVPLDQRGRVLESEADFVNEQECAAFKARPKAEFWRPMGERAMKQVFNELKLSVEGIGLNW